MADEPFKAPEVPNPQKPLPKKKFDPKEWDLKISPESFALSRAEETQKPSSVGSSVIAAAALAASSKDNQQGNSGWLNPTAPGQIFAGYEFNSISHSTPSTLFGTAQANSGSQSTFHSLSSAAKPDQLTIDRKPDPQLSTNATKPHKLPASRIPLPVYNSRLDPDEDFNFNAKAVPGAWPENDSVFASMSGKVKTQSRDSFTAAPSTLEKPDISTLFATTPTDSQAAEKDSARARETAPSKRDEVATQKPNQSTTAGRRVSRWDTTGPGPSVATTGTGLLKTKQVDPFLTPGPATSTFMAKLNERKQKEEAGKTVAEKQKELLAQKLNEARQKKEAEEKLEEEKKERLRQKLSQLCGKPPASKLPIATVVNGKVQINDAVHMDELKAAMTNPTKPREKGDGKVRFPTKPCIGSEDLAVNPASVSVLPIAARDAHAVSKTLNAHFDTVKDAAKLVTDLALDEAHVVPPPVKSFGQVVEDVMFHTGISAEAIGPFKEELRTVYWPVQSNIHNLVAKVELAAAILVAITKRASIITNHEKRVNGGKLTAQELDGTFKTISELKKKQMVELQAWQEMHKSIQKEKDAITESLMSAHAREMDKEQENELLIATGLEYEEKLKTLEDVETKLQSSKVEYDTLKKAAEEHKTVIASMEKSITRLTDHINAERERVTGVEEEAEAKELRALAEEKKLKTELNNVKKGYAHLKSEVAALKEKEDAVKEATAAVKEKTEELNRLKKNIANKEEESQKEIKSLRAQTKQLDIDILNKQAQIDKLQEKKNKGHNHQDHLNLEELNQLRAQVHGLEQSLYETKEQRDAALKKVAELEVEVKTKVVEKTKKNQYDQEYIDLLYKIQHMDTETEKTNKACLADKTRLEVEQRTTKKAEERRADFKSQIEESAAKNAQKKPTQQAKPAVESLGIPKPVDFPKPNRAPAERREPYPPLPQPAGLPGKEDTAKAGASKVYAEVAKNNMPKGNDGMTLKFVAPRKGNPTQDDKKT